MSGRTTVRVFVPATVGNVGPGFDVLGLAVDGLGDEIELTLVSGPSRIVDVAGRDAVSVPRDPAENCTAIAALSLLKSYGDSRGVALRFTRHLPIAGGLGSSAAASVGGAFAAASLLGREADTQRLLSAALDGEGKVAGRHLDNIAPALFGGLCLVLGNEPPDVAQVPVRGDWWVALASPATQLATKTARGVLEKTVEQALFIKQMGATSGLAVAMATGDHDLARRSLVDRYAEPKRAPLIPQFAAVKAAALAAGALGASISGAGPTVFALTASEAVAKRAGDAMMQAFQPLGATVHVGPVATKGARVL